MTAAPSLARDLDAAALRLEVLSGLLANPASGLDEAGWLKLLAGLTPAVARAVVLVHLHGMAQRQASAYLGLRRSAVFQRLKTAYRKLADSPAANKLWRDR